MNHITKRVIDEINAVPGKLSVAELSERYLKNLSEEQCLAAIHFKGPLQVIAGPGSGKTETMTRRAAILIDHYGIEPSKIVLTTFTEKAAADLLNRIRNWIKEPEKAESIFVGTIHSFCLKLLEEYGVNAGFYSRSIRVLDEHQNSLFIFSNFEDLGLKELLDEPTGKNIKALITYYSVLQERGTDLVKLEKHLTDNKIDNPELIAAVKTLPAYLDRLQKNHLLDFSSILSRTMQLIQSGGTTLKEIQNKFQFLTVDEYQDTNPIQDAILRTLASQGDNIAVIGDDDQSIYRFRGATVKNFLDFPKKVKNCKALFLRENRRSTPQILDASKLVVSRLPKDGRFAKDLFTSNAAGPSVSIVKFDTDQDEIEDTANTILKLKQDGLIAQFNEVAVLCYSLSSVFGQIKAAFDARGIPFVTRGDKSFSGEIAIRQVIDLMSFVTKMKGNVKDFSALAPPVFRFLSSKSQAEINGIKATEDVIEFVSERDLPVTSPHDRKKLFKLIEYRRSILSSRYSRDSYSDLLDMFFKVLEIAETVKFCTLEKSEEAIGILNQLGKFSRLIQDFSLETPVKKSRSYSYFKDFFIFIAGRSIDTPGIEAEDAVILQTIHQAKGLEYPVVFMPAMVSSRFPGDRDDLVQDIPNGTAIHKYWHEGSAVESTETDFRRLFYVAITRAERYLFLSHFERKKRKAEISPFLAELIADGKYSVQAVHLVEVKGERKIRRPKKDKLKISSSHLQYYMYCPTRYKFALKHQVAAPHRGYFAFGSNLHAAIEEATNVLKMQGRDFLLKNINQIFERNWNNYGFDRDGAGSVQKGHAQKYFETFVKNQTELLTKITQSEKKFTIEEDNFILTGKIDAVVKSASSNSIVVDFKTGKKDKFKEEPDSIFVENQGNIYVEAMTRIEGGSGGQFYLHFLGEDQSNPEKFKKDITITPESRKNVIQLLSHTADKIVSGDFTPITEDLRVHRCANCEFRNVCPFRIRSEAA